MSRLEEIIQESKIEGTKDETPFYFREVDEVDFRWLIQQAKRVEELEEQLQAIFFTMVEVDNMKVKLERYKQALEFYADDMTYKMRNGYDGFKFHKPIELDHGEKARQALAGGTDGN